MSETASTLGMARITDLIVALVLPLAETRTQMAWMLVSVLLVIMVMLQLVVIVLHVATTVIPLAGIPTREPARIACAMRATTLTELSAKKSVMAIIVANSRIVELHVRTIPTLMEPPTQV
jgi:hypothetical protein